MDFFYLCDSLGENTYYVRIGRRKVGFIQLFLLITVFKNMYSKMSQISCFSLD